MHCEYNTGEELEEFAYEQFCEWARKCHSLPMKEVKKQGRKRTENVTTLRNASIQKKLNEDLKKVPSFILWDSRVLIFYMIHWKQQRQ